MEAKNKFDLENYEALLPEDRVCCSQRFTRWVVRNFSIFNILFYEFTASVFFTYCVISAEGTTTATGVVVTVAGMFVSFLWTARFTGAYLNPAVVVGCMIKKERPVSLTKGLLLIFVEFAGSIAGTFISWFVRGKLPLPFQESLRIEDTALVFGRQAIGTFIYITIVLILVSSDTTFVEMEIQVWFTMPLILIAICQMVRLPLATNPAWGLAYNLAYGAKQHDFVFMQSTWSIIVGPFLGAVLAGFFFEFVFRRFILAYKNEIKRQEEIFMERLNEAQRAQIQFKSRMTILELV